MLSFWESKSWIENNDYTIVGGGLVGIQCAIHLKLKMPSSEVLVIERGVLPSGASTKNAGFACFGSIGELESDRRSMGEDYIQSLIMERYEGLQYLMESLGKQEIDFEKTGGVELFTSKEQAHLTNCKMMIPFYNNVMKNALNINDCFSLDKIDFGSNLLSSAIKNNEEGAINTGRMMITLIKKAYTLGVKFLWSTFVKSYTKGDKQSFIIEASNDLCIHTDHLLFTTNAFTKSLITNIEVEPFRNQVIVTRPISNLSLNGTYHMKNGYVYFRNVGNRILLGGGRHKFMKDEATTEIETSEQVILWLKSFLKQYIHQEEVEIEYAWSGILAGGNDKSPIIKKIDENLYVGVRLGGMGIAIGSLVGKRLADLVISN